MKKAKAIKKIQISIDKMIDLADDCELDQYSLNRVARILDTLRELETIIEGHGG